MRPLPQKVASDKIPFLPVAHHLRPADSPKGPERGDQVDRLENIGFALGVVSQQQVKTGRKVGIQPPVIAEVAKS